MEYQTFTIGGRLTKEKYDELSSFVRRVVDGDVYHREPYLCINVNSTDNTVIDFIKEHNLDANIVSSDIDYGYYGTIIRNGKTVSDEFPCTPEGDPVFSLTYLNENYGIGITIEDLNEEYTFSKIRQFEISDETNSSN